MQIKFHRLTPEGWIPTKANKGDLGFDLRATRSYELVNGETVKVKTDIACGFPEGYGGLILDRSSLAAKGIKVVGGVIDNGYTGELVICLTHTNHFGGIYEIEPGDKIAQLVLVKIVDVEPIEVEDKALLGKTERGDKGFGSSGT